MWNTLSDFILKLLLVVIGTGFFGYLNYLRARRDTRRLKTIEFLDDVSTIINKPLSMMFGCIRSNKTELNDPVHDAISEVFTKRLSTRVKSEAFLEDPSFWNFYFALGPELSYMRRVFPRIKDGNADEIADEVRSRCIDFSKEQGVKIASNDEGLSKPYNELLILNHTLWRCAGIKLTAAVKDAMK